MYSTRVHELRFEWNPYKAEANRRKHGVSFDEAQSAFEDVHALVIEDPAHSREEDRFVLLDMSRRPRVVVVVHCYREAESTIRLISARRATRAEARQYAARRP